MVGIGKPDVTGYKGLDFVIMLIIAKMPIAKFRKDMIKSKRKPLSEIWSGEDYNVENVVRFSPSACNLQPWYVESAKDTLEIYRYKKPGKRGIMPVNMVDYYNKIDIGIFLAILEIGLTKEKISLTEHSLVV